MSRPYYPHTLDDVIRAVDGPFGLVVADMPDGTLWMLKRSRKGQGHELVHYADVQRTAERSRQAIADRDAALAAFWSAIS